MHYSIIQKSQLEGGLRLDAEYYQPEYLEVINKIKKLPYGKLGDFCFKVTDGSHQTPQYQDYGIRFLMVKDVLEQQINFEDNISFISEDFDERLRHCKPKAGDILLTKVGSVGISAVVSEDAPDFNIFVSVAILKSCRNINKFFLSTFLNSKSGRLQAIRATKGISQPDLHLEDIRNFLIPIFSEKQQSQIAELTEDAIASFKKSKLLYQQAEDLILEELSLKDFQPEDDLSYIVNFSDTESAGRLDAEYYQPKYKKLISLVKSQKGLLDFVPISEILSIRRGDFINPDYYVEKSKRGYIRIKELPSKGDINIDAITYIGDDFSVGNLDTLQEDDFIFAGIGATLGKTARITKELKGSFYSNNTVRFRIKNNWIKKIDSCYLQLVLQSMIFQWQIEQRQAQTAQAKIADKELSNILIPILPKPTQQKIADLVRQSHAARKKAKQLLEQAKQKVGNLI